MCPSPLPHLYTILFLPFIWGLGQLGQDKDILLWKGQGDRREDKETEDGGFGSYIMCIVLPLIDVLTCYEGRKKIDLIIIQTGQEVGILWWTGG